MMTAITNKSELYTAYDILKMIREYPLRYVGRNPMDEEVENLKFMIRRYYRFQEIDAKGLRQKTISCGEGWQINLCTLPTDIRCESEARKYVRDEIRIYSDDPYIHTTKVKIVKRGSRWVCYHKLEWSI